MAAWSLRELRERLGKPGYLQAVEPLQMSTALSTARVSKMLLDAVSGKWSRKTRLAHSTRDEPNMTQMPMVLHSDDVLLEGADSELAEVCRWQTLLGSDPKKTSKLTVGVATVFPGCPASSHAHPEDEIYYIISGEGITQVSGVDHSTPAGTTIFIPGGLTHGFRNTGKTEAKLLYAFAADSFASIKYDHSGNSIRSTLESTKHKNLRTVVVHESDVVYEGKGTAFEHACQWRTLCSSDRMPSAKLTLCHNEILPKGLHYQGMHAHAEAQMYYILSGEGIAALDNVRQKVSAGSVMYIPGGIFHKLENTGSDPLCFLDVMATDSLANVDFKFKISNTVKSPEFTISSQPERNTAHRASL